MTIGVLRFGHPDATSRQLSGAIWDPGPNFDFTVKNKGVDGADFETIVKNPTKKTLKLLTRAAQELEKGGAKAITTSCGFNAIWQRELANSVNIPVFTSSLLLVPLVSRMLRKDQKVGIITADESSLTKKHLEAVGINDSIPTCIIGMEKEKEFFNVVSGKKETLDQKKFEQNIIKIVRRLIQENNDIGAIVLECTDLSPFAEAIQRETKLPVFDILVLANMVYNATTRKNIKKEI
jgi:aspartate/glutamate racemase